MRIKCISKINNAEVDNAEDLDIMMLMYNLLKYSENYAKKSASLLKYCRDSKSFKFKSSTTHNIEVDKFLSRQPTFRKMGDQKQNVHPIEKQLERIFLFFIT